MEFLTIIRVLELKVFSRASMFTVQFAAEEVTEPPSLGGCSGTYLITPPGISMLERYLNEAVIRNMRLILSVLTGRRRVQTELPHLLDPRTP